MLKILGVLALLTTASFAQNQQVQVDKSINKATFSQMTATVNKLARDLKRVERRFEEKIQIIEKIQKSTHQNEERIEELSRTWNDVMVNPQSPGIVKRNKRELLENETVAFAVYRTSSFGPFFTDTNVVWQHIIMQEGLGWNHLMGQFIAPFRGLYVFHLVIASGYNVQSMARINKNGQQIIRAYTNIHSYVVGSAHVPLILEIFDQVNVQLLSNTMIYSDGNVNAHFSGYLVTQL